MNNLRRRTLVGLGWNGATQLLVQVLQLSAAVVLARLLSPKDYGLLAMIIVVTGFARSLADMGLGTSIIQKSALDDRHLNSAFWLNIATGILLTVLFAFAAPLIVRFYKEPRLALLTVAVSFNFFLDSLNVVHSALLDKSLNFRAKFWIEGTSVLASCIVALAMAFRGAGVWSLVGQLFAATLVRVVMMWRLSVWRPAFSFDLSAVKELLHFGRHVMGFGIVTYWAGNIDKLVIGRWIGSAGLGIYSLADRLRRLPLTNITNVTAAVMFPALSAIQGDVESVRGIYLRATRLIALITFPMMIGLSVLSEPAILVVYGGKWRAAIVILQLLCYAGLAQSIYDTASWIFLSQGRSDILFRLGILSTSVRAAGVLIGVHWGLPGVAWAYVVGSYALVGYPTWLTAGRVLNLSFRELLKNVMGPFACAISMGFLMWLTDRWIFAGWPVGKRLAVQVVAGALEYGVLVRMFRLFAWMDVKSILLQELSGNQSWFFRWLAGGRARVET
jgi:O-antigen/teichoic acid export membrane protein